jgi:hypothetical protein
VINLLKTSEETFLNIIRRRNIYFEININQLVLLMIFSVPVLMYLLPYTLEMSLNVRIGNIKVSALYLIYIPLLIFIIKKQNIDSLFYSIVVVILIVLYGSLFISNNSIQRFFLSIEFFFPFFLLNAINLNLTINRLLIRNIIIFIFLFSCLQVIVIATGILVIETGLSLELGNYVRRGTTLGSATVSGYLILIFWGILKTILTNRFTQKILWVVAFVSIVLTGTRGAIYPFMIISFYIFHKEKNNKKRLLILVFLLLYIFILEPNILLLNTIISRREQVLAVSDISSGRFSRWADSVKLIKNINIFFGLGGGSTPYHIQDNIRSLSSPHNIYLSFLFENGIFVLLNFILICNLILKRISNSFGKVFYIICFLLFCFNLELIFRRFEYAFSFWLFVKLQFDKQRTR